MLTISIKHPDSTAFINAKLQKGKVTGANVLVAIFGEKDFQQLLVIRRMTRELCMPVEILSAPTVREPDGLAMSSRNAYLNDEERRRAPQLYGALRRAADDLRGGVPLVEVERRGASALENCGLRPDYFRVMTARGLDRPGRGDRELVILAAVFLGGARLIDNLTVDL